MGPTKHV